MLHDWAHRRLPLTSVTRDPRSKYGIILVGEPEEASTTQTAELEDSRRSLLRLFESARDVLFEDGAESDFSQKLVSFIWRHGNVAVNLLGELAASQAVSNEVMSEALRWVGRINDSRTRWARLQLLGRLLSSQSSKVRDGAALGLASLDDPRAIPYLQQAIQREGIEDLRSDLELVLTQLQDAMPALERQRQQFAQRQELTAGAARSWTAPASVRISSNKVALLSYTLGFMTGIVFLTVEPYKNDKFVRFHALQSIFFNVAVIGLWIVYLIISGVLSYVTAGIAGLILFPLSLLIWLGTIAFWVFMMYKAFGNERYLMPLIGTLAAKHAG